MTLQDLCEQAKTSDDARRVLHRRLTNLGYGTDRTLLIPDIEELALKIAADTFPGIDASAWGMLEEPQSFAMQRQARVRASFMGHLFTVSVSRNQISRADRCLCRASIGGGPVSAVTDWHEVGSLSIANNLKGRAEGAITNRFDAKYRDTQGDLRKLGQLMEAATKQGETP